ncbi:MAG: archaeosortase/exosortase family protein, partial [Pyrinomonadaceae bacterium]
LLLAIPIPVIIFNKIAFPLQLFASRCAVWSMRLLDIPVLRDGNIIELMPKRASEPKRLEVVQACSGIRSLMTLVTLAVVFAYFTNLKNDKGSAGVGGALHALKSFSFWRSAIIVLSALPIAILTNAARVSGTGILAHHYGTEVADSFFHSFSGWVIYIVALMLLFAVGALLDLLGKLIHRGGDDDKGGSAAATAQEAKSFKKETSIKGASPVTVNAVAAKGASEL